ncbi:metalloregulator ArsR/SmtB family transcription factor [Pseudomonas neustonica]|uniref:metalloregulator ArsR/SmtB family transcription factor n=1 Tax=Pseudomonas neustonica TaxID=2487346 RepID=UPI003C9F0C22
MSTLTPVVLFKALADDTRARICLLLAQRGELCVCDLTAALAASQPKVSRHLALLRSAGLLSDRRAGHWVYYRLAVTLPSWVTEVLDHSAAGNVAWLAESVARLPPSGCCD